MRTTQGIGLDEHCNECGFTYDLDSAADAADACRRLAREFAETLTATGAAPVRRRPSADVWSMLEYACHVRDVLLVQRERVLLARRVIDPEPPAMGRDDRVAHDGYAEQDPRDVARQLIDAADLFANDLDRLDAEGWQRGIVYGYPPPARRRTLSWVAVHTVHELRHHLRDVTVEPASLSGE
jgi:DinB superfamily